MQSEFQTIKYLSSSDVNKIFKMANAVEVMRDAFVRLSAGEVLVPPRMHLDIPQYEGVELIKPVYIPAYHQVGIKVISIFKNNLEKNLPLSHAVMIIFNATTGQPLAVMDANVLTAIRTGAASGVATDLLSRRDSQIVAIFGAGLQGRTQLEAVCAVRAVRKVLVFDPNVDKAKEFIESNKKQLSIEINIANSQEELRQADIICLATTSTEPIFKDKFLKDGAHINGIGSFQPHTREVPSQTVQRAKVVVDQMEACLKEAGDLLIPIKEGVFNVTEIYGEIGEIIAGQKVGRENNTEITLFKSVGNAVQDLAAASKVLELADQQDIGTELPL